MILLLIWFRERLFTLPENSQCLLFVLLGRLACSSAQDVINVRREGHGANQMKCHICDGMRRTDAIMKSPGSSDLKELFNILTAMIKPLKMHKCRRPRVAAMLGLQHLVSHATNTDHLNLTKSSLGQWCLHSLRSSVRELRLAAGLV